VPWSQQGSVAGYDDPQPGSSGGPVVFPRWTRPWIDWTTFPPTVHGGVG
jgi:hypothetical protein